MKKSYRVALGWLMCYIGINLIFLPIPILLWDYKTLVGTLVIINSVCLAVVSIAVGEHFLIGEWKNEKQN